MFIVIEGLDGSGKSTISRALADKLDAKLISTPGLDFKEIRESLDEVFSKHIKSRQLFYAATVLLASEEIRSIVDSGEHVVVDRYWLSTQVYHNWMSHGKCLELREVERDLLAPDLTVYLDIPFIERQKRLLVRNNNTSEDARTLELDAEQVLRNLYFDMCTSPAVGQWFEVDALQCPDAIVETICKKIHEIR